MSPFLEYSETSRVRGEGVEDVAPPGIVGGIADRGQRREGAGGDKREEGGGEKWTDELHESSGERRMRTRAIQRQKASCGRRRRWSQTIFALSRM